MIDYIMHDKIKPYVLSREEDETVQFPLAPPDDLQEGSLQEWLEQQAKRLVSEMKQQKNGVNSKWVPMSKKKNKKHTV